MPLSVTPSYPSSSSLSDYRHWLHRYPGSVSWPCVSTSSSSRSDTPHRAGNRLRHTSSEASSQTDPSTSVDYYIAPGTAPATDQRFGRNPVWSLLTLLGLYRHG